MAENIATLDAQALDEALRSTNAQIRRSSVWQARCCASVTELLLKQLHVERDEKVLEAIFVALARSGDVQVLPVMLDLLASENVLLRNRALEVLARFPDGVMPMIREAFAHADDDGRIFLVNLMQEFRHPEVLPWLAEVLCNETHVNVIGAALDVIAEIGDDSLKDPLSDVQQRFSHEPFIAFAAALALQRIGAS